MKRHSYGLGEPHFKLSTMNKLSNTKRILVNVIKGIDGFYYVMGFMIVVICLLMLAVVSKTIDEHRLIDQQLKAKQKQHVKT